MLLMLYRRCRCRSGTLQSIPGGVVVARGASACVGRGDACAGGRGAGGQPLETASVARGVGCIGFAPARRKAKHPQCYDASQFVD